MSTTVRLPKGYKRLKAACRVPASVSNLGPGFDSLGLALSLHNELAVEIGTKETTVEVMGEGENELPRDDSNLVVRSIHRAAEYLGRKPLPVWLRCNNKIPLSRGLGSSSAAIVGGVFLANELCGRPLDREALFELAADIEGHPDNVAPALLGGLTVSITADRPAPAAEGEKPAEVNAALMSGKSFQTLSIDHESLSKWKYVVAIPDYHVSTEKARKILPTRVAFEDAIHNIGRAALVVASLLKGPGKSSSAVLREAMSDRLYMTKRGTLLKGHEEVIAAAYEAGALGACVSGSGPAILAISSKWAQKIGESMVAELAKIGVNSRYEVLQFEATGTISLGVHNF